MKYKSITIILIICLFLLNGCTSGYSNSSSNTSNGDSDETYSSLYEENGEATYEDLIDSYNQGWNDACDEVFYYYYELYYDDYQYSYYDYIDSYYSEPYADETYPDTEYPYTEDDASDAYDQGREAALDEIFYDTDVLCYGEERFYRSDY